jgi:hypothetical protein
MAQHEQEDEDVWFLADAICRMQKEKFQAKTKSMMKTTHERIMEKLELGRPNQVEEEIVEELAQEIETAIGVQAEPAVQGTLEEPRLVIIPEPNDRVLCRHNADSCWICRGDYDPITVDLKKAIKEQSWQPMRQMSGQKFEALELWRRSLHANLSLSN